MARTRLHDDGAAVALLGAVFLQARKDIVRRQVATEDRITAIELFLDLEGVDDENNHAGAAGREVCATTGRRNAGAAAARGSTAAGAVGTRYIRRC